MKFRQWLPNGNIHYWGLIEKLDGEQVFVPPVCDQTDPSNIVMQIFSEQYDKDGEALYAGDVVMTTYGDIFQLNPFGGNFVELFEDEELVLNSRCKDEQTHLTQVWVNFWRA